MANNELLIEIKVKPANIFFKTLLFTIAAAPIVIMVAVLILADKIESPFGYFIGLLLFGAMSFFLFRVLLWNTYGKEVYSFKPTEVTMLNDYKWFKDNNRTIAISSELKVYYTDLEKEQELFELTDKELETAKPKKEYTLLFLIDEKQYPSVVKLKVNDLKQLAQELKPLYNNYNTIET